MTHEDQEQLAAWLTDHNVSIAASDKLCCFLDRYGSKGFIDEVIKLQQGAVVTVVWTGEEFPELHACAA